VRTMSKSKERNGSIPLPDKAKGSVFLTQTIPPEPVRRVLREDESVALGHGRGGQRDTSHVESNASTADPRQLIRRPRPKTCQKLVDLRA
jgi:hypothetical protein